MNIMRGKMNSRKKLANQTLNIANIIEQFRKSESNPGHRKDAFKIEGNFEDAVKRIAKAKPKKPNRD